MKQDVTPQVKMMRATKARQVRQETLREYLRGAAYIRILEGIAGKAHLLAAEAVPAAALKAHIYLRLLAKVLPDLRSVEHTGSIGQLPVSEMSRDALREELAQVRATINGGTVPPGGGEQPREVH